MKSENPGAGVQEFGAQPSASNSMDGILRMPTPAEALNTPLTASDANALSAEPVFMPAPIPLWRRAWVVRTSFILLAVVVLAALLFVALRRANQTVSVQTGNFSNVHLPLADVTANLPLAVATAPTVSINGRLSVSNSIILKPIAPPAAPQTGQLFFDKSTNLLTYYNGQAFVGVGGSGTTTGNTTNVTNVLGATQTGVLLQASSPGVQQGGNFNISGTGTMGQLNTTVVSSSGGALYFNPVSSTSQQTIAPGTPAVMGLTSGSSNSLTGWNGTLSATKVATGSVGGTLNSIAVTFGGGTIGKHVQVGIYDDDGDVPSKPGTLLAASAVVTLTPNGTTTVSVANINLTANTTYWLAMKTDDNTVTRPYNGGSKASCFVSSSFGFMPDPFSAPGCFYDNNDYVIYANYTSGAGASGITSQAQFVLGATGQALFQNTTDSTTAFEVQNAGGTSTILDIDTVNGRIGIGKTTPGYKLDIAGGDLNLSNGRSLRFGGSQALSVNSGGDTTSLTNFLSGGSISAQADNFYVQDANATHKSISVDSNGATTFSNRVDTTAGFQVQNAAGTKLLTADTSSLKIMIGNSAGDNNPVILYLANKNTAGDPAGSAGGGTYYNSAQQSFRCFYSGFWHNCADVEPQHSFSLYDEFIGGGTSFSGQIGTLGWTAAAIGANGSLALNPATPAPSASRPGVLRLQTPASANQGTTLMLGDTTGGSMILAPDNDVKVAVATGAATGQVLRVGLHGETTTTTQPTAGVWWEADPAADTHWRYCYGDGVAATCAASAVAIAANTWVTLEIRITASGAGTSAATFVINDTPLTVSAVTIDTTDTVSPALTCYGTNGSAQNCYWDYFQLTGTSASFR